MKLLASFVLAVLLGFGLAAHADTAKGSGYDPAANPAVQLEQALAEAKTSNRKVLVVAGGDWCKWCLILNKFLAQNPDVKAELDRNFVVVKAYFGKDNQNAQFFARLPRAKGYPHFWVLQKDGRVTHSIDTGDLENGADSYDRTEFLRFVREVGKA